MKYLSCLPQWVLGLIYFVFGLNGFFQFLPMPENMPEAAKNFAGALFATGYFFPMLKGTEVLAGALLLAGRAVPFALMVLAPITLNIFCFHFFLTPGDFLIPLVMVVLHAFLGFQKFSSFKPLFR